MTTFDFQELINAVIGMREQMISASLVPGGWIEEGEDPSPRWPYCVIDISVVSWDENLVRLTETIHANLSSEAWTIAGELVTKLDPTSFRNATYTVDIRAHKLDDGPVRTHSAEHTQIVLTWLITPIWK